jgi:polar amino acid transport system ATP-binding protein
LLETVDNGSILLDNTEITAVGLDPNPIRRRIGIVFQSFNLFPHMSIRRNVTLALTEVLGMSVDAANETASSLLARFGLSEKIDSYPDRLSGGQQQRVAIARALALNPEVLLLDEITSALDPELVGEVLDVVRELKGSGITLLLATHEMGFAREISDRVCFLAEGVVAEMGQPEQIFSHPKDPRTQQFLQRVIAAGRLRG